MIGANKILTVSYGTFSCTLEAFDEPFDTMKAIAEYFRDLAAEDRYFGAEPPQPDAEMLHRIAEREIKRRVEAKIHDNGVILRQQEDADAASDAAAEVKTSDPVAAPAAPAPALGAPETGKDPAFAAPPMAQQAPAPEAPVAAPPVAETPVAETPAAPVNEPTPAPDVQSDAPESVAAKLQRIRAAVAHARAAGPDAYEEEEQASVIPQALLEDAEIAPATESQDFGFDLDISGPLDAEEMTDEETAAPAEAPQPEANEPEAEPTPAPIAQETQDAADAAQDDTRPTAEEEAEEEVARRRAARRARRAAKRARRMQALQAAAAQEVVEPIASEVEPEAAEASEAVNPETPVDLEQPLAQDAAQEAAHAEAAPEPDVESAQDSVAEVAETPEQDLSPEEAAPVNVPPVRARVIKVRRPDLNAAPIITREAAVDAPVSDTVAQAEQALAQAQDSGPSQEDDLAQRLAAELNAEADTQAPAAETPAAKTTQSALSEEEEADLLRELAMLDIDDEEALEFAPESAPEPAPESAPESAVESPVVEDPAEEPEISAEDDALNAIASEEIPTMEDAADADEFETLDVETVAGEATDFEMLDEGRFEIEPEAVETPELETAQEESAEELSKVLEADELDAEIAASDDTETVVAQSDDTVADEPEAAEPEAPEPEADDIDASEDESEALVAELSEDEAGEAVAQEDEIASEAVADLPQAEVDEREAETARLMQEADKQSKVVETRRRFSAIAHLKAAVAATVADRISKGQDTAKSEPEDDHAIEPYREDLTQAVRPRRPVGGSSERHARRPESLRPAPLVLVSEQRVDVADALHHEEDEARTPTTYVIRPRRISSAQLAEALDDEAEAMAPDQATSFAEFAETLGTQGLSDLLEAAAAYTSAVEGRPHFSPPQIMRKLTAMSETAEVPREERMRVFGRLLRQGKIAKVKRGQYAITQASRYYDEAKVASGQ